MKPVPCRSCRKEVNPSAKSCPHCGAKRPGVTVQGVAAMLVMALLVWGLVALFRGPSDQEIAAEKARVEQAEAEALAAALEKKKQEEAAAAEKRAKRAKEEAEAEAKCRQDIQCWGEKKAPFAGVLCQKGVEKLAQYDMKWTDGLLETKFTRFRWKNKAEGVVTFAGDKAKFQNGFGAWQNVVYECDLDTDNGVALRVRAQPGRL